MEKAKRKEKQANLARFLKKPRVDLNVECNEMDGENVKIPKDNEEVEKGSARVVQGCANYEILVEEQALMHILDHEANVEGQGSMKSRNYRAEWKFKYPLVRPIDFLGQTQLKCIFCEKFKASGPWGVGKGSVNLQNSGLLKHNLSNQHVYSQTQIEQPTCLCSYEVVGFTRKNCKIYRSSRARGNRI